MGRLRLSRVARAFVGYLAGSTMAFVGLVIIAGFGWALLAAGVAVAAACVLMYDVDDATDEAARRRRGLP